MKIYISQPMRGRTKEEILRDRELGIQVAHAYYPEAEILNNFYEDYDEDISPLIYLSRSCELLSQADLMLLLPFYYGTPGCDVESHIAEAYKIPRLVINFIPNADGTFGEITTIYGKGY